MLKRGPVEAKAVGHATRGPIGPGRVSLKLRCVGEREQEHNEVFALAGGQFAPGMMAHQVAQRRDAAVMQVRRRERDIAQPRYAELAAVLRLRLELARSDGARA